MRRYPLISSAEEDLKKSGRHKPPEERRKTMEAWDEIVEQLRDDIEYLTEQYEETGNSRLLEEIAMLKESLDGMMEGAEE